MYFTEAKAHVCSAYRSISRADVRGRRLKAWFVTSLMMWEPIQSQHSASGRRLSVWKQLRAEREGFSEESKSPKASHRQPWTHIDPICRSRGQRSAPTWGALPDDMMMQYSEIWSDTVRHDMIRNNMVRYDAIRYIHGATLYRPCGEIRLRLNDWTAAVSVTSNQPTNQKHIISCNNKNYSHKKINSTATGKCEIEINKRIK